MLNAISLKSLTRTDIVLAHFLAAFYEVFALYIKLPLDRGNKEKKRKKNSPTKYQILCLILLEKQSSKKLLHH